MKTGETSEAYILNGQVQCVYHVTASSLEDFGIDLSEYTELIGSENIDKIAGKEPFRYNTTQAGGFCLPKIEGEAFKDMVEAGKDMVAAFYKDLAGEAGSQVMADIATCWRVIAGSAVTALILGYIFLFVIRLIGGAIIYLFLIALEVVFILGGLYTYNYSNTYPEGDKYRDYIKYTAYGIWGLAGLELICVCCCWTAIKVAIAVYKTTSQYVSSNLRIQLLPLFSWFSLAIWGGVWIVCAVFVYSVGDLKQREAPYGFMSDVTWTDETRYMFLYQVFGLLWVAAFINGLCQFIIAASTCIWYFTVNTDTKGRGTVGTAFFWGFRYHMGSIAYGSFIIAVVQFIRLLFEWYRRQIQKASQDNKVVKALMCLTSYCLYLLEKCVKFISKNAYIQVALTNDHFCKAAWNAFSLIIANAARFGWATNVGSILNFFGVLAIGAANGFFAFLAIGQLYNKCEMVEQAGKFNISIMGRPKF